MICKLPLHEALKAASCTQEEKSFLGGKTSDSFPVPICPFLSLPIANRKTGWILEALSPDCIFTGEVFSTVT